MDENPPSRCAVCHDPRTARDVRGLAWSSHHTVAGISWVCGPCSRASLFEIETGLPLAPAPLQKSA